MVTSKVIRREQCPECKRHGRDTSEDNLAIYDDGHSYCFACEYFIPVDKKEDFINYTYEFIPIRGITKETLAKYNVKTKVDSDGKPVAIGFAYPNGSTKVRRLDRKEFYWTETSESVRSGLFGRDKFSEGENQTITITEGEFDALSLYQILRSPVVSVQSSSSGLRDCSVDRSFLNSFDRIYLALDDDPPGREAADRIAKLFDPNKVYQLKLNKYKDANDYLQHGEDVELLNIWTNAKRWQPDNIDSTFADFERIISEAPKLGRQYPFHTLNEMTYGIRDSESVLITAQEGVGKTELMHAIEYQLLKDRPDENIGAIFLEEPKRRHLQAIAGLELQRAIHLPGANCSDGEVLAALRQAVGMDERLHLYSHFGSDDPDSIIDTIRFLVTARSCRVVLLDHISMVVSGLAGDDERRALDYLSTRLEMMVKELDFALIMVSHVNDEGKTRGSRYISKIADIRIDATRDTGNPDPIIRNTTNLFVSKNRFSGKTGPACKLTFDPETYTFKEVEDDVWPIQAANDNTSIGYYSGVA